MFALVDCNNFYVSCERVFQPQYNNVPVVVLSNNDGCVISRSDEAKEMGIPMGAPEFKYRSFITENKVKVFSSNYVLYEDLSKRVFGVLSQFSPNVEHYSIDESFINFQNINIKDFQESGLEMKQRVLKWVGIPVCVGIAPTKVLSKLANKIAKKFKEITQGVYVIDSDEKRIKALKWAKIDDIWGVGFRLGKKMNAHGIQTAYDFIQPENQLFIKKAMGVMGVRLIQELQGIPVLQLEDIVKAKKHIAITRTFEKTIRNIDDLKERVSTFADVAMQKLRKQHSYCKGFYVYIRKNKHKKGITKYNFTKYQSISFATQSSLIVTNLAIKLVEEMFQQGEEYTKAGVILTDIKPDHLLQLHLFEQEDPKHKRLMQTIDTINQKFGQRKIKIGNQDLKRTWKMKQNYLSKKYTTDIRQIMEVKLS